MVTITTRDGKKKKQTRADIAADRNQIELEEELRKRREAGGLSLAEKEKQDEEAIQKKEKAIAAIEGAQTPEPEQLPEEPKEELPMRLTARENFKQKGLSDEEIAELGLSDEQLEMEVVFSGKEGQIGEEVRGKFDEGVAKTGQAIGAGGVIASTAILGGTFLNKLFSSGSVSSSAKGVVSAPTKAAASSSVIKTSALTILGFSGLGSLKSLSTNLLTKKIDRLESEVGKLGEQLTKIPEAASLGFSLDEDGKLYEYTPERALQELEGIEQSLNDAEVALKQASIGNTVLKINGKYGTAQAEIEKQRRELTVSRAKILSQIANPSEALQNSREFFRGLDLIEE